MTGLIEKLSYLNGTSGDEKEVSDFIIKNLPKDVSYRIDNIGNLIVEKRGRKTPEKKLMLAAHMDEVGFIITYITDEGYLKFAPVGGISPSVVFGRQVRFSDSTVGVIASKPIHLLSSDEKDAQPKIDELYIDIGADSKEQALSVVKEGDFAYFTSEFLEIGNGFIKAKALDDRAGCAILLELMKKELPYDCTFVFTTQEEIGTRGATCAAYNVKPDFAIVVETTTACDIAGTGGEKQVCKLGEGAVVSYMDRSTIYDRELYKLAFDIAEENDIKIQTKTAVAGGNDSGAIHKAVGGVRTCAVSLPCRYLHSPSCMIKKDDISSAMSLIEKLIERICEL